MIEIRLWKFYILCLQSFTAVTWPLMFSPALQPWRFTAPTPLLGSFCFGFSPCVWMLHQRTHMALSLLLHIICHGSCALNYFPTDNFSPNSSTSYSCPSDEGSAYSSLLLWDTQACSNNSIYERFFLFILNFRCQTHPLLLSSLVAESVIQTLCIPWQCFHFSVKGYEPPGH